jgi:hypothetical protein
MAKFVPILFFVFLSFSLKAQTWEFGVGAGGAGYMGDLNTKNPILVSGYSFSGFAKRNFNGYLSARLNYTYGKIAAADSNSNNQQFRDRNLSFTTTLSEISLIGEFNFMHYIPDAGKNKYSPYLFLGIASVNYSPTTIYNGAKYDLRAFQTEAEPKPYPTSTLAVLYGAGIKYYIAGKFTLGGELGYRITRTDYLDDVHGVYANKGPGDTIAQILADRSGEKTGIYLGIPGTQRGDSRPRDTYFFAQVTFSYTFVTQKCYFQ